MKIDQTLVSSFINKHIIVGIAYLDHEENFIEQVQLHGDILRINDSEGIVIQLSNSEKEYKLPPNISAIKEAPPGEYRFRSTGEVVVNPDFMTTWTIKKPNPNKTRD
ncbi:hypothetical protein [Dehalobacter sp. TBBPA1]|uniref:hypothetical protein n=1 Tax=Dehalobacter sp. TBBPA1 TaxID=3235037 RepID=UPI0034A31657